MSHYIRFTRHNVTGETVATCTCGAMHTNDANTCNEWAIHHLKHGEPPRMPKLREEGFVSGLEKRD